MDDTKENIPKTNSNREQRNTLAAARNPSSLRRRCCGFIFCLKALFSLILAIGALGIQAYWIIQMKHDKAPWVPPIPKPVFDPVSPTQCNWDSSKLSRVEPPDGTFFWGFHLDWSIDTPSQLVERIGGLKPSVINAFININSTDFQIDMINWMANEIKAIGAVFEITLVPKENLDNIPDSQYAYFADQMKHVNFFYGVPVLLRFMHEMNGNWIQAYGQKPRQFKKAFMTMASYVHAKTNMTAMVFGPNIGNGYPFGGEIRPPRAGASQIELENFAEMDTNNDNVVNNLDDPYLPYWRSEYVDWIALSAYGYDHNAAGQSTPAAPDIFTRPNTAYSFNGMDETHSFYSKFAQYGKPFMLGETGMALVRDRSGNIISSYTPQQELEVKRSWWNAIFSSSILDNATPKLYPKFKAATWFEEKKFEESYQDSTQTVEKDYHITRSPSIANMFAQDARAVGTRITWADHLNVTCAGELIVR